MRVSCLCDLDTACAALSVYKLRTGYRAMASRCHSLAELVRYKSRLSLCPHRQRLRYRLGLGLLGRGVAPRLLLGVLGLCVVRASTILGTFKILRRTPLLV